MNLEEALGQFEKAETNVSRIEAVAAEMPRPRFTGHLGEQNDHATTA
jgi:hypothetical protein